MSFAWAAVASPMTLTAVIELSESVIVTSTVSVPLGAW
jgi:hypothetical protein